MKVIVKYLNVERAVKPIIAITETRKIKLEICYRYDENKEEFTKEIDFVELTIFGDTHSDNEYLTLSKDLDISIDGVNVKEYLDDKTKKVIY